MKRTLIALFAAAALAAPAMAQQTNANQNMYHPPGENQGQNPGKTAAQGGQTVEPTKSQVLMLQRDLNNAGFKAGPVDGIMGTRTRQALEMFQRERGLEATGRLDSKTAASLSAQREIQAQAQGQQAAKQPHPPEEIKPEIKADGAPEAPSSFAAERTEAPKPLRLLTFGLIAALGIGGYFGHYWWTERRFLVSTDDVYVGADLSIISAKVSGVITAIPVKENISVHAGDILVQIDDRDYKIAVDSARCKLATQGATIERLKQQAIAQQANIEEAKAQVALVKARLACPEADFERAQTPTQQEFGSKQRLEQPRAEGRAAVLVAEAVRFSAEAGLAVLNTQVKEAECVRDELQFNLDKALLELSFTTVKAPFAGLIENKAVQVGQYVQPGTRLFMLAIIDKT
ncbi:MAG: biotin/lipoyl-binding protein [Methylacidiphilales bacterium]|nr:biotin/lipoyl-binding protein [Candidatus Methylacidiphilales bacterium]